MVAIIIICLIVFGFSVYSILKKINDYHASAAKYESLAEIHNGKRGHFTSKRNQLKKINPEYVGWITIEDTNINYPVVKTKDNTFYLKHNFYREADFAGSIFMDYQNSSNQLDKNIILYGHNMKDASMFGSLKNFSDPNYYRTHRTISFDYLGSTYKWEIFSVYSSKHTDWMKTQFTNQADFETYISSIKKKSRFPANIEVNNNDNILTLSTCTNSGESERYIIHAKLIKKEND